MSTLGKIVYLSEAQASELFANGSITVDGTTITYSANDLYLTPENVEYVNKSGDTMTGALKAKGLRTYVSDTAGNASLNFGETADSTRVGRITMNTTTSRMEFVEGNERYFLPAPTASSETSYDIVTTNGSYTLGGQLNTPGINSYSSSWPGFGFALSSDPTTNLASLNYDNTNKCFTFVSLSNDGTDTTEAFALPSETLTDGNWHNYAILTSKTAVTVAQGGTGATTAADALTNLGALPLAGGTMTGQIVLSGTGFKTNNAAGYSVNAYGNFTHTDTSTTSSWNICKNSGAGVFTVYYENGNTTVGGALTVKSTIQTSGDITIQGPTYPSFTLKKADGTALGSFYASANSGRVNIRTWNTAGTYYVDYGLPDDSDNDASRARYFLTTKDFDFVNYTGTSGTMPGLVKSGDGIWLVSVYDSSDAAKYWVGIAVKKTSTNPVVQLLKNATITCSGGNTLGTMIFSGGSNYVAKALKIA